MSKLLLKAVLLAGLIFLNTKNSWADNMLFEYAGDSEVSTSSFARSAKKKYKIKFNASSLKNNLKFKLPNGEIVKVRLEKRKQTETKFKFKTINYSGTIKGASRSNADFRLSVTEDDQGGSVISGRIRTRQGSLYHLRQEPDNSQSLILIDEDKQLECAGEAHQPNESDMVSDEHVSIPPGIRADSTINVLLAYSPDAAQAIGGAATMESIINRMIFDANLAHSRSHTGITYQLMLIYPLAANSSADFSADLNSATGKSDGKWDELHTLREQYCADQVVVINNGSDFCGMGWLINNHSLLANKNYMFSVVSNNLDDCPYTLAHELAHNLGSSHAVEDGPAEPAFSYSYGYKFVGNDGNQYRTVMAYAPGKRIEHFSNPSVSYLGAGTGTASANNAASLSQTGPIVANYLGASAHCGGLAPIVINTPQPTPTKIPGSGIFPGVPTTLPAIQPDSVTLSGSTNKKQTTFKVKVTGAGTAVSGIPVTIYFDKTGFTGYTTPYANLITNARGIRKVIRKRKKGYYIACYSSLCSAAKKL